MGLKEKRLYGFHQNLLFHEKTLVSPKHSQKHFCLPRFFFLFKFLNVSKQLERKR